MMRQEDKHGLLLVDKPTDCTSHDVVQRVRRTLREKKIGHCGTLDPSATGLLVLTVGRATRLTRFLIRAPKTYEGTVRFGKVTDTYDADGQVTEEHPTDGLTDEAIRKEIAGFEGTYLQQPPAYSAKKIKGKKFYELAREGKEVPKDSKPVEVYSFEAISDLADHRVRFRLSCSSGTYARSLVHDLGQRMGCGAHLEGLRRLAIGDFGLEDAIELDELARRAEAEEEIGPAWMPFDTIPLPFDEVETDPQQERRILHGQTVLVRSLEGEEGDWVKLTNRRRQFVAVGTVVERIGTAGVGIVQPKIVFRESATAS